MQRFQYSWKDFGHAWRLAVAPRALMTSVWLFCLALCVAAVVALGAVGSGPVVGALNWVWGAESFGSRDVVGDASPWLLLGLVLAWFGWYRGGLRLSRLFAVDVCRDRRIASPSLRAYVGSYARYAGRGPLAVLVFLIPALFVLGVWWLLGFVPYAGGVLMALASPIALFAAIWTVLMLTLSVGGLPLHLASVGVRGPDSYESISRVMMYQAMKPGFAFCTGLAALANTLLQGALALGLIAAACALLALVAASGDVAGLALMTDIVLGVAPHDAVPEVLAPDRAFVLAFTIRCLLVLVPGALLISALHANVVVWFLLLRWRGDAAPVTEIFDPREAFEFKSTEMEREQARKSLLGEAPAVDPHVAPAAAQEKLPGED